MDRFRDVMTDAGLSIPGRFLDASAALGTISATPLELARAYARLFRPAPESLGMEVGPRARVFEALTKKAPGSEWRAGRLAWKTGTSNGHRDAWCVGVGAERVVVVWLGNRRGIGHPNLVGRERARRLLSSIAAIAMT